MYFLTKELYFPPVEEASYEGILAVGGDLSVERLLLAYSNGIFPWFDADAAGPRATLQSGCQAAVLTCCCGEEVVWFAQSRQEKTPSPGRQVSMG